MSKNSNFQENQDQKKKKKCFFQSVCELQPQPQEAVTVLYIQTPLDPIHRRRIVEGKSEQAKSKC